MNDRNQLESRIHELEELNRLAQVLSGTEGVDQTLAAIVKCSQSLCDAERASIVLFDFPDKQSVRTIIRDSQDSVEPIDHALNDVVAGHILRLQKPVVTENVIEMAGYVKPSERLRKLGPAMAVPLTADRRVIGMIHHVNSVGGKQFGPDGVRVAEIIANMATQFILRARVYDSLRKDNRDLREPLETGLSSQPILSRVSRTLCLPLAGFSSTAEIQS